MRRLAVVLLLATACATSGTDRRKADVAELLALHQSGLNAHLASDVDQLISNSAEDFVLANRGTIAHVTPAQQREAIGPYLRKTRFSIYRDQVPPIAKVSADGTLGWVIAQVEAKGVQTAASGSTEPLEFVSAWIELYEKRNGRWRSIGNVSNFKPPR